MDNQNQNNKVYYSKVSMLRLPKDAPLESAVFAVSGDVKWAEKKTTQYGDCVAITLEATLGDSSVERTFGKELVATDHKVEFRFLLGKYDAERFMKYPPRWGQEIIFMLHSMKVASWKRKDGTTGYNVDAKCSGWAAVGSMKKEDGTDRKPIKISGMDAAPAATPAAQAAPTTVTAAMGRVQFEELEDDGELPF